jgi:hypothetical protein
MSRVFEKSIIGYKEAEVYSEIDKIDSEFNEEKEFYLIKIKKLMDENLKLKEELKGIDMEDI